MTPEEWAEQVIGTDEDRERYNPRVRWRVEISDDVVIAHVAEALRPAITDVVRSAVADALNAGMPGVPLSAESLQTIKFRYITNDLDGSAIPALLAHIDHVNALFRDLSQDDAGAAYRRGYADGMNKLSPLLRRAYEASGGEWCDCCEEHLREPHLADCPLAIALDLPRQNVPVDPG